MNPLGHHPDEAPDFAFIDKTVALGRGYPGVHAFVENYRLNHKPAGYKAHFRLPPSDRNAPRVTRSRDNLVAVSPSGYALVWSAQITGRVELYCLDLSYGPFAVRIAAGARRILRPNWHSRFCDLDRRLKERQEQYKKYRERKQWDREARIEFEGNITHYQAMWDGLTRLQKIDVRKNAIRSYGGNNLWTLYMHYDGDVRHPWGWERTIEERECDRERINLDRASHLRVKLEKLFKEIA